MLPRGSTKLRLRMHLISSSQIAYDDGIIVALKLQMKKLELR